MRSLKPSETRRGRSWLTNFGEVERPIATLLLDSLQIASADEIHHGLRSAIGAVASDLGGSAAVLIPVLSIEDIDTASGVVTRGSKHIAYDTFQPGSNIAVTPGSEAAVGNVIREFTGGAPTTRRGPWLHPGSSLDELRGEDCKAIALVTDYTSSGRQVIDFAATFPRNPRLRSWRSFGRLKIVAIAHTASAGAIAAIENSPYVDQIELHTPAASFDSVDWSPVERSAIKDLCFRYTPRRNRNEALGFKGSGGLFLTKTSVPNNLPFILRRRSPGWHPFLDGRTMPSDLVDDLGSYASGPASLSALASALRQPRLGRAIESGRQRTPTDTMVVTLALIASGPQTPSLLAHRLATPVEKVSASLRFLESAGFITPNMEITAAGRAEMQHAKRVDRIATAHLTGNSDPYYPTMLR